ncbi:MAG: D-tyrosyl-tRNA(Tyr) deacylase [Clostridiales bacterium]|nr:D-tyrosyl-tRNA(Tyr) deacylase [Clostridiales bacterium]
MKAVVQRVLNSSVEVKNEIVGAIGHGFTILLGVQEGDTEKEAELLAGKVARLRVFKDRDNKMNLSLKQVGGSALVISQFTLCADVKKGNRPSFTDAAQPDKALELYELFVHRLMAEGITDVEKGVFAADMKLNIVNDGPVTILLDTNIWQKSNNDINLD